MLWKCCTQYASTFGKLSSGHRTGKGQFLLQSQKRQCQRMLKGEGEVAQSCPTLCDPVDCNLLGLSVHAILQAKILEWIDYLRFLVSKKLSRCFWLPLKRNNCKRCMERMIMTYKKWRRILKRKSTKLKRMRLALCFLLCFYVILMYECYDGNTFMLFLI